MITIDQPVLEKHVRKEAAQHGLTPGELVQWVLEQHLAAQKTTHEASADDWTQAFERWVDSHARRAPLPSEAFARASFYGESS